MRIVLVLPLFGVAGSLLACSGADDGGGQQGSGDTGVAVDSHALVDSGTSDSRADALGDSGAPADSAVGEDVGADAVADSVVDAPTDVSSDARATVRCRHYEIDGGFMELYECGDGVFPPSGATITWTNGDGTGGHCGISNYTAPVSPLCWNGPPGSSTAGFCHIEIPVSTKYDGFCE